MQRTCTSWVIKSVDVYVNRKYGALLNAPLWFIKDFLADRISWWDEQKNPFPPQPFTFVLRRGEKRADLWTQKLAKLPPCFLFVCYKKHSSQSLCCRDGRCGSMCMWCLLTFIIDKAPLNVKSAYGSSLTKNFIMLGLLCRSSQNAMFLNEAKPKKEKVNLCLEHAPKFCRSLKSGKITGEGWDVSYWPGTADKNHDHSDWGGEGKCIQMEERTQFPEFDWP